MPGTEEPTLPERGSSPEAQTKQAMLRQLARALSALGSKMRAQQDAAVDVCSLGARAEEMAGNARRLAFGRQYGPHDGLRALSEDLDGFAREMRATAERVEQEALLGRAVAEALGRHAAELDLLVQQEGAAEDSAETMSTIRARLRPLAATLEGLPQQMKAGKERTADVAALAARAVEIAGQATALLSGNIPGRQEQMLALARGLGQLAEDAVKVSSRYSEDAAVAVRVADEMAGRATNLVRGPAQDGIGHSLSAVISAGHALVQQGAGEPAPPNPAAAMDWNFGQAQRAVDQRGTPAQPRKWQ